MLSPKVVCLSYTDAEMLIAVLEGCCLNSQISMVRELSFVPAWVIQLAASKSSTSAICASAQGLNSVTGQSALPRCSVRRSALMLSLNSLFSIVLSQLIAEAVCQFRAAIHFQFSVYGIGMFVKGRDADGQLRGAVAIGESFEQQFCNTAFGRGECIY